MLKRLMPSIVGLQCFEAAARHLSFTLAAQELNLTQSAVSKQVAQLEEMLSRSLFHRVKKRLHLTPAGSLYMAEVSKILIQVDMSSRYILTYGGETEILKIATQPTFGTRWLVPRLGEFMEEHPEIHLDVRNELEPFDLIQAKADIAFFFGQGTWPGATCIALFSEEVIPVCTPNLKAQHLFERAEALTGQTLIQCASRPEAWHEWFLAQNLHSQSSYHGPRFDTFSMCIRAAQAGCGIALVPRYLVSEELSEGKLVIALNYPMASNGCHFVAYSQHAGQSPKIKTFLTWIKRFTRNASTERS